MEWLGIDRRRLGTAMAAFGLVGLALAGIMAVLLAAGAFAARDLDERIRTDQVRIGASLTRLTQTMESLAITTDNAGTTLSTSATSVADAETLLETAATTLDSLATSLDVSILGTRPFAAAAGNMGELAKTVRSYRSRAATLGANLHQNATDSALVADQVRKIKGDLNEVATRVAGFDRAGQLVGLVIGGIVLAALLTTWVALAAGFLAWAGWRLRRLAAAEVRGGTVTAPATTATAAQDPDVTVEIEGDPVAANRAAPRAED